MRLAKDPLPLQFSVGSKFIVYLYRDPRPRKRREPIYVGKGNVRDDRAESHWRGYHPNVNPLFGRVLAKIKAANLEPIIEIVAGFDVEDDAFHLETKLISLFGRRDLRTGTLCNLTNGGDGCSNPSIKTRAKISAALKGRKRPPEVGAKVAMAHKGRRHSLETRAKMSVRRANLFQ